MWWRGLWGWRASSSPTPTEASPTPSARPPGTAPTSSRWGTPCAAGPWRTPSGTPVPGYHAPDDVTAISSEILATLLDACAALSQDSPATPLDAHLEDHRDWADGHPAPPATLRRALAFWTRLHGVLSLELAGHFRGMGIDPAQLFAAELDELSRPDTT